MRESGRMRNARILVVGLKGTATEAIKNIVLAGVGKVIVVDGENVSESDLGAGFFFRDEDVGKKVRYSPFSLKFVLIIRKRVDAAKARIQSLNPLVKVETIAQWGVLENESLTEMVQAVDLVCVTDWSQTNLVSQFSQWLWIALEFNIYVWQLRVNDVCRSHKKPFYAGGTYGLLGYIFCDLLDHEFISPYVSVIQFMITGFMVPGIDLRPKNLKKTSE
jgi:ubiquitin-like 1-activating enzyme E1 A